MFEQPCLHAIHGRVLRLVRGQPSQEQLASRASVVPPLSLAGLQHAAAPVLFLPARRCSFQGAVVFQRVGLGQTLQRSRVYGRRADPQSSLTLARTYGSRTFFYFITWDGTSLAKPFKSQFHAQR